MSEQIFGVPLERLVCKNQTRVYGASFGDLKKSYGTRARYLATVNGIPKYIFHAGPENQFVGTWDDEGLVLSAGSVLVLWGELISGPNKLCAKLIYDDGFIGQQFPVL
jgi:hypothetical protein